MTIILVLRESLVAPFLYFFESTPTKLLSLPMLLLLCAVTISACSKPKSEYQNLSEKPPVSVIPHTSNVSESVIQTRLSIPLDRLRERIEADLPELLYNDPGKIKQKCIRIFGKNLCETYQVGGWAQRTGPVQLIPLNNGFLRIAIPLQYKLKVQGNGKVVKELLRNVDFRTASFIAIADLQPRVNANWQLQLAAKSYIEWEQSPKVKVLGVELNIQEKVEKPIKRALDKALQKQQSKMAADNRFRKRVEEFWLTLQQPRKLKGPFSLWLKTNPLALNLSSIRIDNEAIQVAMSLRTTLSTSINDNTNNQPTPLPPLVNRSVENSAINISLPLALPYADIANSLQKRLSKKPLEYKQGKTSITVKSIEIYPNNDRLVLAAKIRISGLANLLSSDGEIYISGRPVVDNQNKTLKLANVAFSRQLDSTFWNTATSLLHKQLLTGLQDALIYDFSKSYDAMYQSINQQLQGQHGSKLKLNGELYGLTIHNIEPDLDELRLILKAQGAINLELTNL